MAGTHGGLSYRMGRARVKVPYLSKRTLILQNGLDLISRAPAQNVYSVSEAQGLDSPLDHGRVLGADPEALQRSKGWMSTLGTKFT